MERDCGEDRAKHVEDGPSRVDQLHPEMDELASVVADDVHANDPAVATLEDELEQPLRREDSAAKARGVPATAMRSDRRASTSIRGARELPAGPT